MTVEPFVTYCHVCPALAGRHASWCSRILRDAIDAQRTGPREAIRAAALVGNADRTINVSPAMIGRIG